VLRFLACVFPSFKDDSALALQREHCAEEKLIAPKANRMQNVIKRKKRFIFQ